MSLRAVVRQPGHDLGACELTHLERTAIDSGAALSQHTAYARVLEAHGVQVETLPSLDGFPDACFVEDPALVLDSVSIMTRPGAPTRVGEVESLAHALAPWRPVVRMQSGTLEGGDVLALAGTLYVGLSSRTNAAGVAELRRLVEPHGYAVVGVHVSGALHLKTAMTALDAQTVVAHPSLKDRVPLRGLRIVDTHPDELTGANVLRLDDKLVLSASAPQTADRLVAMGYAVTAIDLSEFEKAEAGLTCLSLIFSTP